MRNQAGFADKNAFSKTHHNEESQDGQYQAWSRIVNGEEPEPSGHADERQGQKDGVNPDTDAKPRGRLRVESKYGPGPEQCGENSKDSQDMSFFHVFVPFRNESDKKQQRHQPDRSDQ